MQNYIRLSYSDSSKLPTSDAVWSTFANVGGADEGTFVDHGLNVDFFVVEASVFEVPAPRNVTSYYNNNYYHYDDRCWTISRVRALVLGCRFSRSCWINFRWNRSRSRSRCRCWSWIRRRSWCRCWSWNRRRSWCRCWSWSRRRCWSLWRDICFNWNEELNLESRLHYALWVLNDQWFVFWSD